MSLFFPPILNFNEILENFNHKKNREIFKKNIKNNSKIKLSLFYQKMIKKL